MSQHHRSQDSDRHVSELMEALLIPGVSTQEGAISAHVEEKLRALGVPAVAIARDRAQEQSEYGGKTGTTGNHCATPERCWDELLILAKKMPAFNRPASRGVPSPSGTCS